MVPGRRPPRQSHGHRCLRLLRPPSRGGTRWQKLYVVRPWRELRPAGGRNRQAAYNRCLSRSDLRAGLRVVLWCRTGDPAGSGWTETADFDSRGHDEGAKFVWRIDEELKMVRQRITELLQAGWNKVVVITDHGWLWMPVGCRRPTCRHISPPPSGAAVPFPSPALSIIADGARVLGERTPCGPRSRGRCLPEWRGVWPWRSHFAGSAHAHDYGERVTEC